MARKDAAIAGALTALGALMYAKKRKEAADAENVPVEDRTPTPVTRIAPSEYDRFKPTETQYGAMGESPTGGEPPSMAQYEQFKPTKTQYGAMGEAPTGAPTFGKAFRNARMAGEKTFMFGGKKYTTELASTPKATKPEASTAPKAPERLNKLENPYATSETFKRGGKAGSASKRADGIAKRGKTKGRMY